MTQRAALPVRMLPVFVLLVGCQDAEPRDEIAPPVEDVANPAGEASGQPNLAATIDGRVLMTWIEPVVNGGRQLRFAALGERGWSEPKTIVAGDLLLANWADFPSVTELPGGRLVAHYLERDSSSAYAYGVRIVHSSDGGETWSPPLTPHRTSARAEYGFVSLFPTVGGDAAIVWLDGRGYDPSEGAREETTLRFTSLSASGELGPEQIVDGRVCECCQTSVALTSDGVVAVYRDRSEDEIRDISIVRYAAGGWSAPRPVHRDGWRIDACPVNGPAVAAAGDQVAVAWFTAARDTPAVYVAFSGDAGETFSARVRVDEGDPTGRVGLSVLEDGQAAIVWLERVEGRNEVRYRLVSPAGEVSESVRLGVMGAENGSGFPRIARTGDRLIFAWTAAGPSPGIRTTVVRAAYTPR